MQCENTAISRHRDLMPHIMLLRNSRIKHLGIRVQNFGVSWCLAEGQKKRDPHSPNPYGSMRFWKDFALFYFTFITEFSVQQHNIKNTCPYRQRETVAAWRHARRHSAGDSEQRLRVPEQTAAQLPAPKVAACAACKRADPLSRLCLLGAWRRRKMPQRWLRPLR